VVAPSRIPRAVAPGAKTDRLDCIRLAEYGAKGMVKPIAIPSEEEEAERSLLRRRHQLVDELRRTKQRIKSHLLCFGVKEPAGLKGWSRRGVAALQEVGLLGAAKCTLESMLRELEYVMGEQAAVEKQLKAVMEEARHKEAVEVLRSVPGVGPVVAMSWRLELFRPERFRRAEEVASYLGLAPMVRQSGSGKARARIRPVGQRRLRSLLVEAAWLWKARDPQAEQWYRRCLARTGIFQKAITALARKLAVMLWRLSVERRPYSPVWVSA
jgi:transposase